MTKYINKLTGAELDYDKVHEDFERSLTWDHETDPEEFLMEAYEFEYEEWLVNQGIEEITVPDPVKPKKKTAKRKSNAKTENEKVTVVFDNTISSLIRMYQEWSAGHYNAQEFGRIGLEVEQRMEEHPEFVEEIILLYGSEDCAYYEELYDAPTIEEKRLAFAEDLVMREGFKAAHQCR